MSDSPAPTTHDRVLGALLGVHAGDSLGATLEFEAWERIRDKHPNGLREIIGGGHFDWPAGHATDDTDLTRAVLLAYREVEQLRRARSTKTLDVVKIAAHNMVDWYDGRWPDRVRGQRPRDIGGATAVGISRFKQSADPRTSGAGEGRAGNGSLMRCIPTALFQPDADKAFVESVEISAVTHDDFHCTISCAAYNAMVRSLVDGESAEEAWEAGKRTVERAAAAAEAEPTAIRKVKMSRAAAKVEAAMEAGKTLVKLQDLAANGPKGAANASKAIPFKAAGHVLESLTLAVAALLDPRPLEDVLVDVVCFGQDTDTNGAIAGGLLGARDGVEAIPLRWREKLQFGKEFTEITDYLLAPQESGH
ncbi:ADP-ribosylation/Crystallin J1 [Staphylotrichum tortipilum]|uniref:ADP-ribosylhydrolase ARH3 n=1 Tax=Staphylotrichum tortipilum TaxID=2831512 RepID=A0AAN6MP93_9PEZI|nr:ADP-ribosylation/Crystallin J1 [Staphylotrichum longicolle]